MIRTACSNTSLSGVTYSRARAVSYGACWRAVVSTLTRLRPLVVCSQNICRAFMSKGGPESSDALAGTESMARRFSCCQVRPSAWHRWTSCIKRPRKTGLCSIPAARSTTGATRWQGSALAIRALCLPCRRPSRVPSSILSGKMAVAYISEVHRASARPPRYGSRPACGAARMAKGLRAISARGVARIMPWRAWPWRKATRCWPSMRWAKPILGALATRRICSLVDREKRDQIDRAACGRRFGSACCFSAPASFPWQIRSPRPAVR